MTQVTYVDTPRIFPMPFSRKYQLATEMYISWEKEDGTLGSVVIPKGYTTDGASIPSVLWQLIGTPYAPEFITAALIHDYMCDNDWDVKEMSEIFEQLLLLSNVSASKASAMYAAVYAYKTIT